MDTNSKPLYKHDCNTCRYLGSGPCKALGDETFDFYICEANPEMRCFIARYGNDGPQYISGTLFECVELTRMDKVALINKLSLNEHEHKRLLRVMLRTYKNKLSPQDYMHFGTTFDFGDSNIFYDCN